MQAANLNENGQRTEQPVSRLLGILSSIAKQYIGIGHCLCTQGDLYANRIIQLEAMLMPVMGGR